MQVEVSTLPDTTEAGYCGLSMEPGGMITVKGFKQPALSGISSSTKVRNTYSTAAMQTADGALKLLDSWLDVPVKSMVALRVAASTRIATLICAPLSRSSTYWPSFRVAITRRTASSALSCTWPIYACTTGKPKWATILCN